MTVKKTTKIHGSGMFPSDSAEKREKHKGLYEAKSFCGSNNGQWTLAQLLILWA